MIFYRKHCFFRDSFENTSAIFVPRENKPAAKPKFDLKASLAKPLAYKPHKGALKRKAGDIGGGGIAKMPKA